MNLEKKIDKKERELVSNKKILLLTMITRRSYE